MAIERSVMGEHGPFGFPNMSAIRERLTRSADTTAVEFWQDDFGEFAKAVMETVRKNAHCSSKQAEVIVKECLIVASRRQTANVSGRA